ncbi:hypothetical protein SAMN05444372_110102 [Flavobacterium micromati]|jgi:uncharacterized membrane protein HdeD (DUF308 family)|uniref:Holin n=1 Tax=Flavobacterium micromati TaxID=229205 RepID=A0A1M5MZM5_9FLAO|nr:hypothetical protein [Flavobacterium micromati]SHG82786.1 hypothetical protein SAMN05444372_110102 [Flavobacterium micromati]
MKLVERAKSPTPKFFRILRTVGLALLAISGSVIAAPVVLPVAVVSIAGYLAVAGGVLSAVSQLTVGDVLTSHQKTVNRARDGG